MGRELRWTLALIWACGGAPTSSAPGGGDPASPPAVATEATEATNPPADPAPSSGAPAPPPTAPDALPLGPLPEVDVEMGCSCTFSFADGRPGYAASGEVDASLLRVRVGARTVTVRSSAQGTNERQLPRRTYLGDGVTVVLDTTSLTPCTPGDLECEGTRTTERLTVTEGAAQASVDLVGGCGC